MSILHETMISLHDAAQIFPSHRPGKMNFSTIWRWGTKGVYGAAGQIVKLEMTRIGGRWLTSQEALDRFSVALTAPAGSPEIQTPTGHNRANVKKKLAAAGI